MENISEVELQKWSEETDREKKRLAEQIKSEFAGSLSSEDEDIINEWAFELNI